MQRKKHNLLSDRLNPLFKKTNFSFPLSIHTFFISTEFELINPILPYLLANVVIVQGTSTENLFDGKYASKEYSRIIQ